MPLILKDGIWYWSNGVDPVTAPAALYAPDVGSLLSLSYSPPIGDVICPRSITFTLAGSPSVTINVAEDAGKLDFSLNVNTTDPKSADLSGLFFDLTNSKLSTLSVSGPQITQFLTGAGGIINLTNGVNLNGLHLPGFDVGMEFGLAGIGSNHQNIQSEKFVLSDAANDLSINDLHPAGETGNVGVRTLSVGQKLAAVAPYAPTATPDTVTTLEDVPTITIPVSALATDKNSGAILTITEIGSGDQGPQYGKVTVASDGKSLIYTPTTLDYEVDGILTGNKDAFQVCVTDNFGGQVTSFVTVNATPVADAPQVVDKIAAPHAGDPATLVRFDVTITSTDFATITQGSDYIKSLALSLTGTNTGLTITDGLGLLSGGLINAPANPGTFTDEILVSLPAGSKFSDTLSMTGTNAETENTGSPATAATTISQTITADTETTLEDTPISVPIGDLVSGPSMAITQVAPGPLGPKYGTVAVALDGQSLTYTPTTLDDFVDGTPTGNQDVFQVYSSDGAGNNAVTLLTVNATPVADTPTVNVQVLTPQAGDPINEVRLLVTSQSGDFGAVNAGSDFIQSIGLNLTGTDTAGTSISDSLGLLSGNTIKASSNQGNFVDEVDLLMPVDTTLTDSLAVTATAAETEGTGSPATAAATTNQSIAIDNAQLSQNLDFQTSGQSIWDSGAAFSKDYNTGFLGIDTSYSTSKKAVIGTLGVSTTIASAGASVHFRAGVQADLKISAGDISATLPFNVGLDSTYNKTTDTLQIMPTDAQLGGGHFTAHGPSGSFSFGLDLGLAAAAHATIVGTGASFSTSIGSFTSPVYSKSLNSTQLSTTIDLGAGVSLTLAFPNVNTTGSGGPGTISGTGVSNDIVNLSGDLVAMASTAIFGSDVTDVSLGPLNVDILDLILGIGLDVVQKFDLNSSGLTPVLTLEDGTMEPLSFGAPLTIANASSHDSNHDGNIGFSLALVPTATLTNNTSLGASLNAGITALALSVSGIGSFTAFKASTTVQLGTFPPIYSNTFALNGFGSHTVTQTV